MTSARERGILTWSKPHGVHLAFVVRLSSFPLNSPWSSRARPGAGDRRVAIPLPREPAGNGRPVEGRITMAKKSKKDKKKDKKSKKKK
jgi:hypothetical protein